MYKYIFVPVRPKETRKCAPVSCTGAAYAKGFEGKRNERSTTRPRNLPSNEHKSSFVPPVHMVSEVQESLCPFYPPLASLSCNTARMDGTFARVGPLVAKTCVDLQENEGSGDPCM
ncbi:hypothetical protein TRVL_03898 [Trypanosoma vivax]|nr:hypothetical protein TRVL_03898 [Trypanosoma vivax]